MATVALALGAVLVLYIPLHAQAGRLGRLARRVALRARGATAPARAAAHVDVLPRQELAAAAARAARDGRARQPAAARAARARGLAQEGARPRDGRRAAARRGRGRVRGEGRGGDRGARARAPTASSPRVIVYARDLCEAMLSTIQSSGIGAMRPNTARLVGWPASLFAQAPPKAGGSAPASAPRERAVEGVDARGPRARRAASSPCSTARSAPKRSSCSRMRASARLLADIDSSHALHQRTSRCSRRIWRWSACTRTGPTPRRRSVRGRAAAAAARGRRARRARLTCGSFTTAGCCCCCRTSCARRAAPARRACAVRGAPAVRAAPIDDDETRRALPPTTPIGACARGRGARGRLEAFPEGAIRPSSCRGDSARSATLSRCRRLSADTLAARGRQSIVSQIQRRPSAEARRLVRCSAAARRHRLAHAWSRERRLRRRARRARGDAPMNSTARSSAPDDYGHDSRFRRLRCSHRGRLTEGEPARADAASSERRALCVARRARARRNARCADAVTAQRLRTARALNAHAPALVARDARVRCGGRR